MEISSMTFDVATRKLTLTGKNFIPPGHSPSNFDLKVWLMPRGEQIADPTETGARADRGLI